MTLPIVQLLYYNVTVEEEDLQQDRQRDGLRKPLISYLLVHQAP